MHLVPKVTLQEFDKWEIYFFGSINPPVKISRERYVITAIDYLTIWDEAEPIKYFNVGTTAQFLF
jgi:hypothetical protein